MWCCTDISAHTDDFTNACNLAASASAFAFSNFVNVFKGNGCVFNVVSCCVIDHLSFDRVYGMTSNSKRNEHLFHALRNSKRCEREEARTPSLPLSATRLPATHPKS